MTNQPFAQASPDVVMQALARKLTADELPTGDALARAMIDGFFDGQSTMKSMQGKTLTENRFFDHQDDSILHRIAAERYLENLPGLLDELDLHEDAAHARLLIQNDRDELASTAIKIFSGSETGYAGVHAALINYQKQRTAEIFGNQLEYRTYTSGDLAADSLSRAADYLTAGFKTKLFRPEETLQAAYGLGQAMGAGCEAMMQAANAFDDAAYDAVLNDPSKDWLYEIALALSVAVFGIVGVIRHNAALNAAAEVGKIAISAVELSLSELFIAWAPAALLAIGTFAVLAAVFYLCFIKPDVEQKHVLIAEETADRTRAVLTNKLPPMQHVIRSREELEEDEEQLLDDSDDDDDEFC